MGNTEYSKRWSEPKYLAEMQEVFKAIFVSRANVQNLDLRGIVVGLDGAPASVLQADFQDTHLKDVDLSYGRFSCAFSRAHIQNGKFSKALFDTCRLKESRFLSCVFDEARFDSPLLDDAYFSECSFSQCKFVGRGSNEYGGRRVVFERCSFGGAVFQNLHFRACTFKECFLDETLFRKCLMVGTKFDGPEPAKACFVS